MSEQVFAWVFLGGDLLDNWSTVAATVGNAHVDKDVTVPTGKRWLLICGSMSHDDSVSHLMTISVYNAADKKLFQLVTDAGGAGARPTVHFPASISLTSTEAGLHAPRNIPLKAGDYIRFEAATNMTDATVSFEYVAVILEIDAP